VDNLRACALYCVVVVFACVLDPGSWGLAAAEAEHRVPPKISKKMDAEGRAPPAVS